MRILIGMCLAGLAARGTWADGAPDRSRFLEAERQEGLAFRMDCRAEIGGACLNFSGRALIECLEKLGNGMSKPCAERIARIRDDRKAKHERIPAACKTDVEQVCAGVAAGGINACLRTNAARISKSCRESLK